MSRYQLAALPAFPGYEIVVGWDPRGTYFAYVLRREVAGEDPMVVNVGDDPGDITEPAEVLRLVAPYAEIPADLAAKLSTDVTEGPSSRPRFTLAEPTADQLDRAG